VIAALSTGHKIGLLAVAGLFIGFALISAFVLPRRQPEYPGKRLALFIGVSVAFFAAMLAAVVIFGSEPKEPRAAAEQPAAQGSGDPTHGKALFASKGCNSCHSIDGSFITGPSFKGLAGSKVTLADGSTVTADDAYLLESIEDPGKQVVKCPHCGPPSVMAQVIQKGSVSKTDATDLVAYIKTLK
jgi:cytochrome c551/c552